MKWARVAKFSAALVLLCAVAICAPLAFNMIKVELRHRAERPDPVVATSDETRAILTAVLDQMDFVGIPPPPPEDGEQPRPETKRDLILADESLCFSASIKRPDCELDEKGRILVPELDRFAPRKLREELLLANQEKHSLELPGIPGTKMVPAADIQRIFKAGWWSDFYKKYPDTSGFAEVSRPVLSEDRQQALVYIAHHCDGVCGTGTILLLAREGSEWRVVKQEMLWIS
jgi:hypothetical protein